MDIIAILAHVSLIFVGITWFNILSFQLEGEFSEPPLTQLFSIFGIYGALVLLSLHALTWVWSGMATVGIAASIFLAPIAGLWTSYSLRNDRQLSKYHNRLFMLGLLYIPAAAFTLIVLFFLVTFLEEGHL